MSAELHYANPTATEKTIAAARRLAKTLPAGSFIAIGDLGVWPVETAKGFDVVAASRGDNVVGTYLVPTAALVAASPSVRKTEFVPNGK